MKLRANAGRGRHQRHSVLRRLLSLVLRQGAWLTGIGVTLGLAGAYSVTGVLTSLLFGVTSTDPATFAVVPLVLAIVALLACYLPARHAST